MTTIEQARPDDWRAALELALSRLPADARRQRVEACLQMLQNGPLDPRGVWIARQKGVVVGAQICVPLPGASCLFWLPIGDAVDAMLDTALQWFRGTGGKIAQAVLMADDLTLAGPLFAHGFQHITRIHILRRSIDDPPTEPPTNLRFESYRPALESTFAAVLERTYLGTRDCPELNGTRTMDEVLAGHRGQGRFHPEAWWLVFDAERPIGVLLLTELPDAVTWELMYLGVVPEARQRGFGRAMTLHAFRWLRDQPATQLTLSVDERNAPARRLYRSLGFVECECHEVLLRFGS